MSYQRSVRMQAHVLLTAAVLLNTLACHVSAPSRSMPDDEPAAALPQRSNGLDLEATRDVAGAGSSDAAAIEPSSGLVLDARTPLVIANCTVCHSAKLVIQSRGTRVDWEERVRSMQKSHNLWPLEASVEDAILDYLSEHYAPDPLARGVRRLPLRAHLLPPSRADLERQPAMSDAQEDRVGEPKP